MDPGSIYYGWSIFYETYRKWTPIDSGTRSIFIGGSIFYGTYRIWTPIDYGPRSNLYRGLYCI